MNQIQPVCAFRPLQFQVVDTAIKIKIEATFQVIHIISERLGGRYTTAGRSQYECSAAAVCATEKEQLLSFWTAHKQWGQVGVRVRLTPLIEPPLLCWHRLRRPRCVTGDR